MTDPHDPADAPGAAPSSADAPAPVEAAPPASGAKPDAGSLKKRAVSGGKWSAGAYGLSQIIRLANSLILTRLLAPEAFGLMAVVTIFLSALQMLSDLGTSAAVIQSKRDDDRFVNTAWTLQALRGVVLWGVSCAIAYPVSMAYNEPAFVALLPFVGLNAIIDGLKSTRVVVAKRKLDLKPVVVMQLCTQVFAAVATLVLAWKVIDSVWALAIGSVLGTLAATVWSHTLIPGIRNSFAWDKEAIRAQVRFGLWVFFGTVVTFFAAQTDKLIFSFLVPMSTMGVFWIGVQLGSVSRNLAQRLGGFVGFPALSELYRRDRDQFNAKLLRVRRAMVIPLTVMNLLALALGPAFVVVVLPVEYASAGFIVQVLACSSLAGMVVTTYGQAYLATGQPKLNFYSVVGQFFVSTSCVLAGYALAGVDGFFLGMAVTGYVRYCVECWLSSKAGFWQRAFDVKVLLLATLLAVGAIAFSALTIGWFWSIKP
ncbi:MAG: oligosaccharide flippase family protein [Planctomycetota bacterium]